MPDFRDFILTALLLAASVQLCRGADDELDDSLSFWDKSLEVRGAAGYKDNVLLSRNNPEGSPFWLSGVDFSLFRASLDDSPTLTFFLSGEDRRYSSAPSVDKEQLLLSQAKVTKSLGDLWTLGMLGQYVYADQVFDASSTEQILEILPVKSQNIQFAPSVARALPGNSKLEARFTGERQIFQSPLDSYWEAGPSLTWTKSYGHHSELSAGYTFEKRFYDTRHPITLAFDEIPNRRLIYDQHKFEAGLNHWWDESRHWRSRAKFLFEVNEDNGAGFFDYYRWRVSHRFGYYAEKWEASLEAKVLHYDYARQPVFGTDEVRGTWEFVFGAHAERRIWKKLKLFIEGELDKADSNYAIEQYLANTVMTGFDWEF